MCVVKSMKVFLGGCEALFLGGCFGIFVRFSSVLLHGSTLSESCLEEKEKILFCYYTSLTLREHT